MDLAAEPTPPSDSSREGWASDVVVALATLRHDERSYIRASYFDGTLHSVIAEQAGVPTSDVSRTIATGMRRLAFILENGIPVTPQPVRSRRILRAAPPLASR